MPTTLPSPTSKSLSTTFGPIDFKTRFPALDGLRALAVTMVFFAHYGGGAHGGTLLRWFNVLRLRGGSGVSIFFVLSGFLITGILYDTRNDSESFRRFFARRAVRIFPVYYLLFLVLALLTPFFHYQWKATHGWFLVYAGNLAANFDPSLYGLPSPNHPAASAGLSHLYSLCLEEQFYLLWPCAVFLIRDRVKLLWLCGLLCAGALALRLLAFHLWSYDTVLFVVGRMLPFRIDDLCWGALLALLLRGPSAAILQRSMKWLFLAALIPFLLLQATCDLFSWQSITFGWTLFALASMGLIGMTLTPGTAAFGLFNLSPMRMLGRYSYGFYLWHAVWADAWRQALVWITARVHSLLLGGIITLPLCFACTLLVAKLSYDLFEVRFLKLKHRFEYDSELATHRTAFAIDGN